MYAFLLSLGALEEITRIFVGDSRALVATFSLACRLPVHHTIHFSLFSYIEPSLRLQIKKHTTK